MKNLLLIKDIQYFEIVVQSVNANTDYVLLSKDDTYSSILTKVKLEQYQHVGLFSHGNHAKLQFLELENPIDKNEGVDADFLKFLMMLKARIGFSVLDLFGCYSGVDTPFFRELRELSDQFQVRATNDQTGNGPDGNWYMEVGEVDVKDLYFTDEIDNFMGLLGVSWSRNDMMYASQELVSKTSSGASAFMSCETSYNRLILNGTNLYVYILSKEVPIIKTYASVQKVCINNDGICILLENKTIIFNRLVNGNIVESEDTDDQTWSNSDEQDIYLSSQLEGLQNQNFYSIHVCKYYFAAVKEDGTVICLSPRTDQLHKLTGKIPKKVHSICSSQNGFSAITIDKKYIYTWGHSAYLQLTNFRMLGDEATAQTVPSGSLQTPEGFWSNNSDDTFEEIFATNSQFCVLTKNRKLYTWGALSQQYNLLNHMLWNVFPPVKMFPVEGWDTHNGRGNEIRKYLTNIIDVYGNADMFTAIKETKIEKSEKSDEDIKYSIISWGKHKGFDHGQKNPILQHCMWTTWLKSEKEFVDDKKGYRILSTSQAFCTLLVAKKDHEYRIEQDNRRQIQTDYKGNYRIFTWGNPYMGHDHSQLTSSYKALSFDKKEKPEILSCSTAFAIKYKNETSEEYQIRILSKQGATWSQFYEAYSSTGYYNVTANLITPIPDGFIMFNDFTGTGTLFQTLVPYFQTLFPNAKQTAVNNRFDYNPILKVLCGDDCIKSEIWGTNDNDTTKSKLTIFDCKKSSLLTTSFVKNLYFGRRGNEDIFSTQNDMVPYMINLNGFKITDDTVKTITIPSGVIENVPMSTISAGVSGDPYLKTFKNIKLRYKLKGLCANFRLLSYKDLVVNGSIAGLTQSEQALLKEETGRFSNGNYFDSFFIHCGTETVIYDRYLVQTKNVSGQRIIVQKPDNIIYEMNCPIQGKQPYTKVTVVVWPDPDTTKRETIITIELRKFVSREVLNGLEVFLSKTVSDDLNGVGGILNSLADPREFKIRTRLKQTVKIDQPSDDKYQLKPTSDGRLFEDKYRIIIN